MAERSDIYHDVRVQKEANSLFKAGYRVCVLGLRETGKKKVEPTKFELTTFRVLPRKYGILRKLHLVLLIKLINLVVIFSRADIYHAHNTFFLPGMWISSRLHGGRFVYDSHEVQWEQTIIEETLEKKFINSVDRIINVAEGRANLQAERYRIGRDKITVISNYPVLRNDKDIKFKGKGEKIRFIYSGGFNLSTNRLDNLVRAMKDFPELYFDLMAFGYGNDDEKLSNIITEFGLDERVKFIPLVSPDMVVRTISGYDFAVNMLINPDNMVYLNYPSINKIYEYMAAGLPMFCSDLPAFRDEIISTGTGICVDPMNKDSIKEGLAKIIKMSGKEHLQMKEKAYALAIESYNWSTQETRLIKLYEEISG